MNINILAKWFIFASLLPTAFSMPAIDVNATKITTDEDSSGGRRLKDRQVVIHEDISDLCEDTETKYKTYYQVYEAHLLIVAEPENSDSSSCPRLAFHALTPLTKEILMIEEFQLGPEESLYDLNEDDYTLEELLRAYEQVEMPAIGEYDVVTNNCASFVLDMFCYMGYQPKPDLLAWTISRLLATDESTNAIMSLLHDSSHLTDLPTIADEASLTEIEYQHHQSSVIGELVYVYAATHEGSCIHKMSKNSPKSTNRSGADHHINGRVSNNNDREYVEEKETRAKGHMNTKTRAHHGHGPPY